jgi:hypothetical protein
LAPRGLPGESTPGSRVPCVRLNVRRCRPTLLVFDDVVREFDRGEVEPEDPVEIVVGVVGVLILRVVADIELVGNEKQLTGMSLVQSVGQDVVAA